jgi:hypothetical protein
VIQGSYHAFFDSSLVLPMMMKWRMSIPTVEAALQK